MQFQVPQFETENKFFGPFTIIQFVYVGVSVVVSFLLFPILTTWFWFAISSFLVGTSLAVSLVKINGRPMLIFIVEAFHYFWGPKILTFRPLAETKINSSTNEEQAIGLQQIPPLSPLKKFDIPRKNPSIIEPILSPVSASIDPVVEPELPTTTTKPSSPVAPYIPPSVILTESVKINPLGTFTAPPSSSVFVKPSDVSSTSTKIEAVSPAVSATPFVSVPPPIVSVESFSVVKQKKSRLQNLFNKITTSSSPLLFREESLKQTTSTQKGYELVEKLTGETVIAKRVDYR